MNKILRLPDVMAAFGRRSHTSVYGDSRDSLLTKAVSTGPRARGWPQDEVEAIVAARVAGCSDAEIRALVGKLHAARGERWRAMGFAEYAPPQMCDPQPASGKVP